jgi:hypothetical protein
VRWLVLSAVMACSFVSTGRIGNHGYDFLTTAPRTSASLNSHSQSFVERGVDH